MARVPNTDSTLAKFDHDQQRHHEQEAEAGKLIEHRLRARGGGRELGIDRERDRPAGAASAETASGRSAPG